MVSSYLIGKKREIYERREAEYCQKLENAFVDYAAPDSDAANENQRRIIGWYLSHKKFMEQAEKDYAALEKAYWSSLESFCSSAENWVTPEFLKDLQDNYLNWKKHAIVSSALIFDRPVWRFEVANAFVQTSYNGLFDFNMYSMKPIADSAEQCGAAKYLAERMKTFIQENEPDKIVEYHQNDKSISFML